MTLKEIIIYEWSIDWFLCVCVWFLHLSELIINVYFLLGNIHFQGLPLHVQIDTFEDPRDTNLCHRGYCQIKVFCDKVSKFLYFYLQRIHHGLMAFREIFLNFRVCWIFHFLVRLINKTTLIFVCAKDNTKISTLIVTLKNSNFRLLPIHNIITSTLMAIVLFFYRNLMFNNTQRWIF